MNDLSQLLNPEKYQVLLVKSPASFPLSFAIHPWFVINKKGIISRWGVGWRPQHYDPKRHWGHVATDVLPPFEGLRIFYFLRKPAWRGTLVGLIEGDETSVVKRMIDHIENSPNTYPFKERYSFLGPNSNTYAQWVINQFPEVDLRLPWNAFGKGYA